MREYHWKVLRAGARVRLITTPIRYIVCMYVSPVFIYKSVLQEFSLEYESGTTLGLSVCLSQDHGRVVGTINALAMNRVHAL